METEGRRKGVSQLGTEKTSMSEPLRHLCWSFKTHCGAWKDKSFTTFKCADKNQSRKEEHFCSFQMNLLALAPLNEAKISTLLYFFFLKPNYNFCILKERVKKRTRLIKSSGSPVINTTASYKYIQRGSEKLKHLLSTKSFSSC